jgi:uncharacterized membrane protein YdbT with pleckstrin-like domain
LTSDKQVHHEEAVWVGRPWITPAAIIRTISVIVVAIIFLVLEAYFGAFSYGLVGLPLWLWTIVVFILVWLFSLVDLLILRASNKYVLRQDGIEVRRGIIRLHSFVVTPMGFGDLLVYQSLGGRIFGYGDITVNSQGERQTKLFLVHDPFKVADTMRDIMGKPIVRVNGKV